MGGENSVLVMCVNKSCEKSINYKLDLVGVV
jgi:hypothetical protein